MPSNTTVVGTSTRTSFVIEDHGVRTMLSAVPKVTARMMTQALRQVGQTFCYNFTAMRLGGPPGITVRQKRGGTRGSNVKMPPAMRKMGFKATVFGQSPHARKRGLWIGTRSPAARLHETGGLVTAKNKPYLAIHLREGFRDKQGKMAILNDKENEIVFYRRSVRIPARLGFTKTWIQFVPRAYDILQFQVMKIVALVNSGVRT